MSSVRNGPVKCSYRFLYPPDNNFLCIILKGCSDSDFANFELWHTLQSCNWLLWSWNIIVYSSPVGASITRGTVFGSGTASNTLVLQCNGREALVSDCPYSFATCQSNNNAGVLCQPQTGTYVLVVCSVAQCIHNVHFAWRVIKWVWPLVAHILAFNVRFFYWWIFNLMIWQFFQFKNRIMVVAFGSAML